jgi:hypothetical protein
MDEIDFDRVFKCRQCEVEVIKAWKPVTLEEAIQNIREGRPWDHRRRL